MLNHSKNKIGDMALKKMKQWLWKKPRPDEGIIALSSYTTIIKKSIKIMYLFQNGSTSKYFVTWKEK